MKFTIKFYLCLFVIILISSCSDESKYNYSRLYLFKNTKVWELAKAVYNEDTFLIKHLAKNNNINFQEPRFSYSLLEWSIENDKYLSCQQLLKLGADPNLNLQITSSDSSKYSMYDHSAIGLASDKQKTKLFDYLAIFLGFRSKYNDEYETTKYIRLLLKYGASKNINCNSNEAFHVESAMNIATRYNFEIFKILSKNQGDFSLLCEYHGSPIANAFIFKQYKTIYYILKNNKIDFDKPISYYISHKYDTISKTYISYRSPIYISTFVNKWKNKKNIYNDTNQIKIIEYLRRIKYIDW